MIRLIQNFSLLAIFFSLLPAPVVSADTEDLAERVVIVVNSRDADSVRVGQHYADRRGIPAANIIEIDPPREETISRQQYVDTIHNPLLTQLMEKGWVSGLASDLRDDEGRLRSIIDGHRISYLVLCRGVPLRINKDPARITPEMERGVQEQFRTNEASVDSELAVLLVQAPSVGFVPNPLFQQANPNPINLQRVLKVARLDGPSAGDAMALVDSALQAERDGLRGRAYIDTAGPNATGTEWLQTTAGLIRDAHYDLTVREQAGVFPVESRFDAPALYFGWYALDMVGPFQVPGFRFPPGAIALHIHSFSARTLRSDTAAWCGPFVARGVAVTLGNVFEPYLELSHQPHLFVERLLAGANVGDAAIYSIRGLSWQGVLIGDPLYRPFALPVEEQVANALRGEGGALSSYSVLRKMNELAADDDLPAALALGRRGLDRQPGLALAFRVAQLQAEAGERRQAVQTLRIFTHVRQVSAMEIGIAREAAALMVSLDQQDHALTIYEMLLDDRRLTDGLKRPLLEEGLLLAERLNRAQRARDWRRQLASLSPPLP